MNSPTPSQAVPVRFEAMTESHLDAVTALEQQAHPHPWQKRHFADCLANAYEAQLLMAGDSLLGYFVAMKGFEEVHLLNITVAPIHQRQGWARVMLDALALWSSGQGAQWLWLEARQSNTRAIHIYQAHGFRHVGVRRQYYPATSGQREDAVVMSLQLNARPSQEPTP
jgi:ribosomal-protein-alanine N-acetyltransferase